MTALRLRPWVRWPVMVALLALVAGLGTLSGARPAGAHASLSSSSPADGARLEQAPRRVTLNFTEGVSVGASGIRVLDTEGSRVDDGDVDVRGDNATVELENGLPDGGYVVAWRAISADSHPIDGALTFLVGSGTSSLDTSLVDDLVGDGGEGPWRVAGAVSRFLAYGGALLTIGLAVFMVTAHDGGPERDHLRSLLRTAAAVGAAGLLVELPTRAALATGLGPDTVTRGDVLERILADNVGIGLLVALLALLFLAVDAGRDRIVVILGSVAIAVGFALAGHTAATSPLAVAVGSDATHVLAAGVWLGGLAGVLTVLVGRRGGGGSSASVIVRFSIIGGYALAGVAVAGSILGWTQVRSVDALVSTSYGQLLMVKVAVVALVACIGGWNHYRLIPVLEQDLARESDRGTTVTRRGRTLCRPMTAGAGSQRFTS